MKKISQKEFIRQYFISHPDCDISHPEVVDSVTELYKRKTGKVLRDPDRAIRTLSQEGFLIKVKKGVYRYDPNFVTNRDLEDFSEAQKEEIKKRDGYKCVICGLGVENGVELQVDHIFPKDKGGKAIIENGQSLCGKHNYIKKTYGQTEMSKMMFVNMYITAKNNNDSQILSFCSDVLETYEKHGIDPHIKWKK